MIENIEPALSPTEAFELVKDEPFSFFLDGGMDSEKLGRYSFVGSSPFLILSSRGEEITITSDNRKSISNGNPLDVLNDLLETYRLDSRPSPVPFLSGATGYLGYDLCHFMERLPMTAVDDLRLPECYFGFYDLILAFDNLHGSVYIISSGFPELDEAERMKRASQRLKEFKEKLAGIPVPGADASSRTILTTKEPAVLKGGFTHQEYADAVEQARQYIINGDIFEVNLSQRLEPGLSVTPYELYSRFRWINPAPFAFTRKG